MASRKIQVEIIGDASSLEKAFGRAGESASGFEKGLNTASKGAAIALGAIGLAAKVGFAELADSAQVAAQTGAVIKSTGSAANVTAKQVDTLAQSLLAKSGVDDEAIASGENMLLTFTKVRNEVGQGNDIFNQATKATLNLSVAMGKDMQSSAILVGKALNDPIKGMTALTRAGIQFTDAQKDTIASLVASGDQMGAQKVILKELETQFGGSAEAAGGTFAGKMKIAKEQAKNFAAELVAGSIPTLNKLSTGLGAATGFLSEHKTATQVIIGVLAGLSLGVLAVNAALKVYAAGQAIATAAQWLFNAALTANPVGLVIVAVAALGVALVIAYQKSETFRDVVQAAFRAVRMVATAEIALMLFAVDKFLGGLQSIAQAATHLPFIGDKFKGVAGEIGRAREQVRALSDAIRGIPDKTVNITVVERNVKIGEDFHHRAHGGAVHANQPYIVGERGPELFVPGSSGGIVPNQKLGGGKSRMGGGGVTNVYVNAGTIADPNQLQRMIVQALTQYGRDNGTTVAATLGGRA